MAEVTQNDIAEARLNVILDKKFPAVKRWKDIPYYEEDTTTLNNHFMAWSHPAYTFRNPINHKTGGLNIYGKIFRHIVAFPGEGPTKIRRLLGLRENAYGDLFQCLRFWKLAISINGKYYPTNTGVRYFKHFFFNTVEDVDVRSYYDFREGRVIKSFCIEKENTKIDLESTTLNAAVKGKAVEPEKPSFEKVLELQVENAKTFDELLKLKQMLIEVLADVNSKGSYFVSQWEGLDTKAGLDF